MQPSELASDVPTEAKPLRGGLLAQLDAQLNSLSSPNTSIRLPSVYVSLPLSRSAIGNSVKPEPTDLVIPRKRTSPSLTHLGFKSEEKPAVSVPPVSKPISSQVPKAPLIDCHTESFEDNVHRQVIIVTFKPPPF